MLRLLLLTAFLYVMLHASTTKEGLDYINSLRIGAGLIPLNENKALSKAANSHAQYLIENQHNGHYQKEGKYAYTAKTPSERAIKAGYPSRITMENLSLNTDSQRKSIDNLFSAIYHRFVFLNLDKNEIGLGDYEIKKKRRINRAYVYDLGSSSISKLCLKSHEIEGGQYYMKNVCKKSQEMIPQSLYNSKKSVIEVKNKAIIFYPYEGQQDVYPAFYNESPDPLPKYKVSGFPISVQFNPSVYTKVKVKSFKLYNSVGTEIKRIKIIDAQNDRNNLFTKLEFALMPLVRLEYGKKYKVIFEAIADGINIKKTWEFMTLTYTDTLYRVSKDNVTLHANAGQSLILYMVPSHGGDLLTNYRSRGGMKAEFLDQNTLKVTLPRKKSSGRVSITFANKKKVSFIVE